MCARDERDVLNYVLTLLPISPVMYRPGIAVRWRAAVLIKIVADRANGEKGNSTDERARAEKR